VLPIDDAGRVLLVRAVSAQTGGAFWFPPGGGFV
jgi:hypothetical protein